MEKLNNESKLHYTYLNYHLSLLSEAIKANDTKEIELQKRELEKIRKTLFRLGYFEYN